MGHLSAKRICVLVASFLAVLDCECELSELCSPARLGCTQFCCGLQITQGVVVGEHNELTSQQQVTILLCHGPILGKQVQLHARVILHVTFARL